MAVKLTSGLERLDKWTGLNPDQKHIIDLMRSADRPARFVWSNNWGTGKSATLNMVMLDYLQRFPGAKVWYGRKHIKHLYENNLDLLQIMIPQDLWKYKVAGGVTPTKWTFPNGSEIRFVGFHDPNAKLGGAPTAAFLEEISEITLEMFNFVEGRVGRQANANPDANLVFAVGNPRGHTPIYRKVCKGEGVLAAARKNYLWYKGDPMGNKRNMPPMYYENLMASFPKELVERFVLGSDDTHAGQVYAEFNREMHCGVDFKWNQSWIPFIGADYGKVDPTAVLFCGFDPATGDVYVLAEHYASRVLVPAHAEAMEEICHMVNFPWRDERCIKVIDNNTNDPDGGGGKSIIDWFGQCGWFFQPSKGKRGSLMPGIEKIQNLLLPRKGAPPKMHIHPRCTKTIEEFWMYEWEQPKNPGEMMKFKEVPKDDWNHCMDALRYAVTAMPIAESPAAPAKALSAWAQMHNAEENGDTLICADPRNYERLMNAKLLGRTQGQHFLLDP